MEQVYLLYRFATDMSMSYREQR